MRNLKFLFLQFFLFIFIFSGFTYKSSAQDNWDFTIAPYFWFASLSGDATLKGNTSEVDASFSDLWDALNFAASLRFEAYNKPTKFGILIDGAYFDLGDEATTDFFNSLINIKTEVEVEFLMLDQGIFYRFIELDSPVQANLEYPKFTLDGLFFGRIWYMDQTIDIQGQGPAGLGTSVSDDQTWFDFNLGLRSSIFLTEKLRTILRTDVGGFGLGFSSDFTWSGLGAFGYALTDHIEVEVGYRGLYFNYDDGSGDDRFELDLWMHNPFIALNFTF